MKSSDFNKELQGLTPEQLDAKLLQLKDELYKLRFQQAINQLDNPTNIGRVKKNIARVLTVKRAAELKAKQN